MEQQKKYLIIMFLLKISTTFTNHFRWKTRWISH